MTIDEALLYDAEWWLNPTKLSHNIQFSPIFEEMNKLRINFGWKVGSDETDSWFNLLIREAIKC